jgi:hypothetical protein
VTAKTTNASVTAVTIMAASNGIGLLLAEWQSSMAAGSAAALTSIKELGASGGALASSKRMAHPAAHGWPT